MFVDFLSTDWDRINLIIDNYSLRGKQNNTHMCKHTKEGGVNQIIHKKVHNNIQQFIKQIWVMF